MSYKGIPVCDRHMTEHHNMKTNVRQNIRYDNTIQQGTRRKQAIGQNIPAMGKENDIMARHSTVNHDMTRHRTEYDNKT